MNWIDFDPKKGGDQPLPPERKEVLVEMANPETDPYPPVIVVGYLKYYGGVKDEPYFVTPGAHGHGPALQWCDCLPPFKWPKRPLNLPQVKRRP